MSGRTSVFTFAASIVALLTLLSGCSGRNVATNPENEQWFCQSNESGEGWECVQDDNLALIPVPTRMPPEPVPEEDPAYIDLDDPLALEALNAPLQRNPDAASITDVDTVDVAAVETATAGEAVETAAAEETVVDEQPAEMAPSAVMQQTLPAEATESSTEQPPPPPPVDAGAAPAPVPATTEQQEIPRHVALAYTPPEPMMITELPSDFFALQMLAVNTPEEIEAYIKDNRLVGMSGARVENNGDIFYVLIVGIYETYGRADEAAKSLPPPLDDVEVWIRPLGSLQQAMLRADEMAGGTRF